MKKFILPIILLIIAVLFLSPKVNAQANPDCHGVFTKESNSCLKANTKCLSSCVDKANAAMSLTVDGGKVMQECTRSVCDPASKACNDKAMANFRACGKSDKSTEVKQETPKQSAGDNRKFKLPVFIGEWFREVSDWISLGEFAIGMKEVASNLTITDDAIIEDEKEEKEWDQYYESYNSLKSQGRTHEQIEAVLQKPRKRDVSLSLQELDALKAKFPTGENITDVAGTTNTKLYSWESDSGALIKSTNWEKIEFKQPVVKDSVTIRTVKLEEGEIEVKVRNNKPTENQFGVDAGWLGVTVSRTHFRVLNDRTNKSVVVIVYEGEVEVKTRDGKIVKVKPDGDKPGVVGVSQKLSPVKLTVVGMVLAVIIGGTLFFLKKKKSNTRKH